MLERLFHGSAKLIDTLLYLGINRTGGIQRNIQQKWRTVAHGAKVHISQLNEAFRSLFVLTPEPTGGDARIGLRHNPLVAVGISRMDAILIFDGLVVLGLPRHLVGRLGVPFAIDLHAVPHCIGSQAVLVARPPHIRLQAALEDNAIVPLKILDGLGEALEIIYLSILSRTLGAVHPDLNELAVSTVFLVTQNLAKLLVIEIVVVLGIAVRTAVRLVVDIPRRQV